MTKKIKGVILDISSPDPYFMNTSTKRAYEIITRTHTARSDYNISSVVDGGTPLWISTGYQSCVYVTTVLLEGNGYNSKEGVIKLLAIYIRDREGTKKPLYYENNREWICIVEEDFYKRFHTEALKRAELGTLVLNIRGDNDPKLFHVNDSPDFPFAVYAPNAGRRITKVTYGNVAGQRDNTVYVIWCTNSQHEGCIYASFYPKNNPKVGYLVIRTKNGFAELFYLQNGWFGGWTQIERDVYLEELKKAGFDESKFSNEIMVDLSKPDDYAFRIIGSKVGHYGGYIYTAPIGFRLKTLVDGDEVVWKAVEDERSTYMNAVHSYGTIFAFFILIDDPQGDRKVLYFIKDDSGWKNVEKSEYHTFIPTKVNGYCLPKLENPKLIMSSFRNKQGLKIISYASLVDNPKGDVIFCHGIRSYFVSTFGASDTEWNFERFGSPIFLDLDGIFLREGSHERSLTEMYKHIFEYGCFEGENVALVLPAYEYEGSIIEFLNKLGYNVYGFDLQSHGLSDAQTDKKCHVSEFKDYIHDILQFINIVKRGAFDDKTEKWNERITFQSIESGRKTFLWGNSMGGNIIIQAVQEFYRMVNNPKAKLVDGLIVTSGMFSLDHHLDTLVKRCARPILSSISWYSPTMTNPFEKGSNYGELFDLFLRNEDPFFKTTRLTVNTIRLMLDACDDVNKKENMAYYPRNLPTLFIHSKDDPVCGVKGPKGMVEKLNEKNATDLKFVEIDAAFHYLTTPQSIIVLQKDLKEWLDKYT